MTMVFMAVPFCWRQIVGRLHGHALLLTCRHHNSLVWALKCYRVRCFLGFQLMSMLVRALKHLQILLSQNAVRYLETAKTFFDEYSLHMKILSASSA